jgi:hypothetical protein
MDLTWLKTLAPMVGTALAGPFGGIAAAMLADKMGLSEKTVEAVTSVLTAGQVTAEQASGIRLAEIDFLKFMADHGLKQEALVYQDRADARKMQTATRSPMPAVLTIMVTVGFFGVLAVLLENPDLKSNEVVLVMVGQLSAVWGACVAFYVSTTFSSANKTELLAHSTGLK